jgi:hypothetical protein
MPSRKQQYRGVAIPGSRKTSGGLPSALTVRPFEAARRFVSAVLSLAPFGFGLSSQRMVGPVAAIRALGVVTWRDRMART